MKKLLITLLIIVCFPPLLWAQQTFNYKRSVTWTVLRDDTRTKDKTKKFLGSVVITDATIVIDNNAYNVILKEDNRDKNAVVKYKITPTQLFDRSPYIYVFYDETTGKIFCVEYINSKKKHTMYFAE